MYNRRQINRKLEPYYFLSPSYLILIVFMLYPLANCIRLAFCTYKLNSPSTKGMFCGFENFRALFETPDFWMICKNTLIFVVVTVSLQFVLGMVLALALWKPFKMQGIVRAIVFLPWAFSGFVVALTFRWLFNGEYGPINDILLKLNFIKEKLYFLSSPDLALSSVIVALTWQGIPFFAMMVLSALQSIPTDIFEAAKLDGAGAIQRYRYVTIPYIKPTIVLTLLLRVIWVFNNAEMIYVMTGGGPANYSSTLASYMFQKAYSSLDFGQAGALGLLFIIILSGFAIVYLRLTNYGGD